MPIAEVIGYLGSLFSVATYAMKTMIPLRILALGSNLFSAAYGFDQAIYPMLVLHLVLMPINSYRLYEMVNLVRRVKKSSRSGFDMKWLKPFMSRSSARAGEVLFRKGDSADAMYLVISGRFVLSETGIEIPHGSVVGEFGLFAPGGCRTQTLQCLESGEILTISYEHFKQLYFQNPEFGFYFLELVTARLFENLSKLETTPAADTGAARPEPAAV